MRRREGAEIAAGRRRRRHRVGVGEIDVGEVDGAVAVVGMPVLGDRPLSTAAVMVGASSVPAIVMVTIWSTVPPWPSLP